MTEAFPPCPHVKGATGETVPFYENIVGNLPSTSLRPSFPCPTVAPISVSLIEFTWSKEWNKRFLHDWDHIINFIIIACFMHIPFFSYIHGPCHRFRGDHNDEDTRTFCGKFLYNAIASKLHNTRIVLPVAATIARAEICLGCWRDRPFLNRTCLVFDEVIPMGRQ